jgi:hypothetical protein
VNPLAVLAESPETGAAFARAGAIAEIGEATAREIDLLVRIRDAAAELAESLDSALATLRLLSVGVDELIRAARDD